MEAVLGRSFGPAVVPDRAVATGDDVGTEFAGKEKIPILDAVEEREEVRVDCDGHILLYIPHQVAEPDVVSCVDPSFRSPEFNVELFSGFLALEPQRSWPGPEVAGVRCCDGRGWEEESSCQSKRGFDEVPASPPI